MTVKHRSVLFLNHVYKISHVVIAYTLKIFDFTDSIIGFLYSVSGYSNLKLEPSNLELLFAFTWLSLDLPLKNMFLDECCVSIYS